MEDFISNHTLLFNSILNYSTGDELTDIATVFTSDIGNHQSLLEGVIIENETILSKNTNESLSKLMEHLSLLGRIEWRDSTEIQDNDGSKVHIITNRTEDLLACYSSSNTELHEFSFKYRDLLLNESDNFSFSTFINSYKQENKITNEHREPSFIYLNDSQQDALIASIFASVTSPVDQLSLFEDLRCCVDHSDIKTSKNSLDTLNSTFNDNKKNDLNESDSTKQNLLTNKLKQYETKLHNLLHKNLTEKKTCDIKEDLSKNVLVDKISSTVCNNSSKKSDSNFLTTKDSLTSSSSCFNNSMNGDCNITKKSFKPTSKKNYFSNILCCDQDTHESLEAFLKYIKKGNNLGYETDNSNLQEIRLSESIEYFQNNNDIRSHYEKERNSNIQKSATANENKPQKSNKKLTQKGNGNENNFRTNNKNNNHRDEYSLDSLNNTKIISFCKSTNPKSSPKNPYTTQTFHDDTITGASDNVHHTTSKEINTIAEKTTKRMNSIKTDNKNEKKQFKIYSSKNFSKHSKIKFDVTEIISSTQILKREISSRRNKNADYNNNDNNYEKLFYVVQDQPKDSSKLKENCAKKVHNISDRISARLRQHNFKTKTHKSAPQTYREICLKEVIYTLSCNKNKINNKGSKNNNYATKTQDNRNLAFEIKRRTPKPKMKLHVKTTELKKFIISKFPNFFKENVLLEYESIIEIINNTINRACTKRAKVNTDLTKLKKTLYFHNICQTEIEFYTFVMNYTPFYFQHKVLPLNGAFCCKGPHVEKKLSDSLMLE